MLLKLARGAGTRGLAGIYPKKVVRHQPSAISNAAVSHQSRQPSALAATASTISRQPSEKAKPDLG